MTTSRRRRTGSEAGQTTLLGVLFLVVLICMMAAVIDVGAWMRADRKLQADADAAALAAAQELPYNTGLATAKALEYGGKNGASVGPTNVTFETKVMPNDIVVVRLTKNTPGVFTGLFGVNSVNVHATAKARAGSLNQARYAAPIAVDIMHEKLQCQPDPCFNQQTVIDLEKTGPGAFRLINLDRSHGGTGQQDLANWILHGFAGLMPLDNYYSDPGAKFNASQVISALNERIGDTLLFPVYDDTRKSGANFDYHVIGWVGFTVTGFDASGNNGKVFGYFTSVIWEGIMGSPDGEGNFGARTVALVE
jgi:Flp pilus assembly protein TadG